MNRYSLASIGLIAVVLIFGNAICADEWVTRDASIMGTTIHTEVWHEDRQLAEQMADQVLEIMERVNAEMSPYLETSELSKINREGSIVPVKVSAELFGLIADSLEYSYLTDGAFDITYASVGYLYDYRNAVRPDNEQIQANLPGINFTHIKLNRAENAVGFSVPGVRIDLGGIAKGYAVDLAVERARELGIKNMLVSAGGDTRILGDRNGRPWIIGVRHPVDRNRVIAKIPLVNEAISTSGDYERYFDEDGVRYHHIIDPKTGDSARSVRSVTILGRHAMDTDALSTSVFVLGAARGLALLESLPHIEGIIVDSEANLLFSSGLQNVE